MVNRTATCSGREEMSGNVRRMSVKTFETGCELALFSGFRREETLGYGGPASFCLGIPCAASRCRLSRKSIRMLSRVQVGAVFLIGVENAIGVCSGG